LGQSPQGKEFHVTLTQARPVTVCIPSNRPLAISKGPIESAIRFAGLKNYRVVISDNSGEGAKLAYFSDLPDYVTYLTPYAPTAIENLIACLDAADTEYILSMGDDDYVEAVEGLPDFDFSTLGPKFAGVRPLTDVFAVGEGVLRSHAFTIDGESAADRMYEYRQKVAGDNTLFYSYLNRKDFREMIGLLTNHPIVTGDMDWAVVYSLVASGKFAYDASTRFQYDIGKWRWNEGIEASIREIYERAGLPPQAAAFEHLFRFLDAYVFAFRKTLQLSDIDRVKSLFAGAVIFLGHTLHTSENQPHKFIGYEREIAMLRAVLKEPDDYLVNVFDVAAQVADRLKPGLHERYVRWFASVQDADQA
jgi:hypothetical protein